jgi:hypothetical protein
VPWGLLERREIDEVVRPEVEERRGTLRGLFPSERDQEWAQAEVDLWVNAHAATAYRRLGALFCTQPERVIQWDSERVAAPSLCALLDDVRAQYSAASRCGALHVRQVSATLLDVRLEYGAADHFDKMLGLWSGDELKHHLFAGRIAVVCSWIGGGGGGGGVCVCTFVHVHVCVCVHVHVCVCVCVCVHVHVWVRVYVYIIYYIYIQICMCMYVYMYM